MLRFIIFFRSKATGSSNIDDKVSQHPSKVQSREDILLGDVQPIGWLAEERGSIKSAVNVNNNQRLNEDSTEAHKEHEEEVYREV
jgi:hypothetical protein